MPEISVVIPVYRAAASLAELYARLCPVLEQLADDFEILFVEDCGGDDSWGVIQKIAASDGRVRGFRMSRNYGQHNAVLCGIREARGDLVVTMDDDLQHPPEELFKLFDKIAEGYDVVYGPPIHEQHGFLRDMASRITKVVLQKSMGAETAGQTSALRVFKTRLRDAFDRYRSPFVSIDVLLTWGTTKFAAVPVRHEPRKFGESGYTTRKLVNHAINMITGFSVVPLQIASLIGLTFSIVGVLVFLYVIGRYIIVGGSVAGFPFLASIIAMFSGVQLFSLGVIGEYLARMHFRSMERTPYLVAASTASVCTGSTPKSLSPSR